MGRFKHFFNSCEAGFRNEFIIWLYARVYSPNKKIQSYGKEADEVVLILTESEPNMRKYNSK